MTLNEIFLLDIHCLPIYCYPVWIGLIVCYYFIDCASDTDPTGYTNLANTLYGESATADCDGGNGYAGTAVLAAGACKTDGTWDASKFSGCALAGTLLLMVALFSCQNSSLYTYKWYNFWTVCFWLSDTGSQIKEWTQSNAQQNIQLLQNPTMGVTIKNEPTTTEPKL